MLNRLVRRVFPLLSILTIIVIIGCSPKTSTSNQESTQEVTLSTSSDIPSMNMTVATDLVSFNVMNNVFEGLYTKDKDGKTIPALASKTDISKDFLTYTFHLRKDAKWSNGDPVTAKDFVFSWRKMVDPAVASGYGYMYDGLIANATEIINSKQDLSTLGVEAVDDNTLKVTLTQPTTYFLDLLSLPFFFPMNQTFVEAQGDDYGASSEHLVYNGPFLMKDWDAAKGGSWILTKNPDYYDHDKIKVDKVTVRVIATETTNVNLYENKQLDYVALSGDYIDQYKDRKDFHSRLESTSNFIELNHTNPILANQNVRQALTQSINMASYAQDIMKDGSVPIYGFVPSGLAYNPNTSEDFRKESGDLTSYNPEQAKEAWAIALSEMQTDSVTLTLTTSDTDKSKKVAEYIQDQLQTTLPGLTIIVKPVPFKVKQTNIRSGDFEMAMSNWIADFADPVNYVERFHSGITRGKYKFDDVDALLDQAKAAYGDPIKRWELLVKAEQVAIGQHYVQIPLYQTATAYLLNPNVHDIYLPVFGSENYRYITISQ
ncbi:peptide ABC transporter substrate-binding protein [Granulicatella seriolae]|uniref:Peptide ABC transporter substrate-binding protein n=1 Tax=Granulicatella seriolae TaxID=2967226 RepID=A0ABT1WML5_9LACT|nr:peptide ABC transporter substrate-binding protein [Granulicatella seriolae]